MDVSALPPGQHLARTYWGTHESGAAFDRKKTSYLTEQTQAFIVQQAWCVMAGLGPHSEPCGLITLGQPGFVSTPDAHTCLLRLDPQFSTSRLLQGLRQSSTRGCYSHLGLFFICHPTRERLCVQGTAELLPSSLPLLNRLFAPRREKVVRLHVHQSFFHCAKYIKTHIAGLTAPLQRPTEPRWRPRDLLGQNQTSISEAMQAFITQQVLCFLCTMDQHGHCAVNHRGGAAGFLVVLPPDEASPGGTLLLPDYAGNGAFEAIGNILETGRAALVIPNYPAQLALCVSGTARIVEVAALSGALAQRCQGAERVVALAVQQVETQYGDWSAALAYERARAQVLSVSEEFASVCPL